MTVLSPRLARPESPGAPVRVRVGSPTVVGMPSAHRRRPVPLVAASVLALLFLMAGCGQSRTTLNPGSTGSTGGTVVGGSTGGVGGGEVQPAPPSGAPAPLPEPPGSTIVTPLVSDPVAGQRVRRVAWQPVKADPTSAQVVVQAVVGGIPCDRVTGIEAVETGSTVAISVWAGPEVGATGCDGPQPALAQIVWVRVPLAGVLGSRTVLPYSPS